MTAAWSVVVSLLALGVSGNIVLAQPASSRLFTAGVAIAISCPGAHDDIPVPEADCSEHLEGAPGPYARPT